MQVAKSSTIPSVNDVINLCWILHDKPRIVATFFFQPRNAFELFFIVPSLQISCFRKTKARKTVRLKISVSRPDLFDSQSFTVCVIFAYILSWWGGENNGFLAGASLAPSHLARPKPPFLSFSNACHHRQPRLCRSSLEFEFYRECRRTNKIRSNFRHNLSVIFAVLLGFIAGYC